ncbi:MAG: cation diffusion facilitator family transporter [Candidatus Aminicenantes bacterium]|nr:cation diffusion facilitator family transporter [Candidatus Aminicenantes bacterium]
MPLQSINERQKKIRSITLWGVLLNIVLMALKLVSGMLIRSSALIADGVHSLSDLATDFVVLIGARLSNRPADKTHPYGHGKLDTIASILIALVLLAISFGLIWSAGTAIYQHKHNYPGYMILVVASVSVVSKEILFYVTRRISRITQSTVLYANAWHHRSDSFSSLAVLIGGVASLLGWGHADQVATIIVGFMIIGVAGKIFFDGLIELSEHSADSESIQKIEEVLSKEAGISSWHALRTRKLGAELFIDVHLLVDPALSVQKSHDISIKIEGKIKKELSKPSNILVHIEPDIKKMHKPKP